MPGRAPPPPPPPPPWKCRGEAVVWLHRSGPEAADLLPGPLLAKRPLRVTVGGFVRYTASPVGSYGEVFGGLVRAGLPPRLHVRFMAVDSPESLRGGRANWALPKVLGRFTGRPATSDLLRTQGEGWSVDVRVRPLGPAFPAVVSVSGVQLWPDGTVGIYRATMRGRARLACAAVEVDPASPFAGWLLSGRHVAVQWDTVRLMVRAAVAVERR